MRVFVAEQVAASDTDGPVREIICWMPVFAGLVMLESNSSYFVAEQKSEIVVIIMVRAVEFSRFNRKVFV